MFEVLEPSYIYSSVLTIYFCGLLITYANSLDPDQDRQNVRPDPDPILVFLKESFEKEKNQQMTKKLENYQAY